MCFSSLLLLLISYHLDPIFLDFLVFPPALTIPELLLFIVWSFLLASAPYTTFYLWFYLKMQIFDIDLALVSVSFLFTLLFPRATLYLLASSTPQFWNVIRTKSCISGLIFLFSFDRWIVTVRWNSSYPEQPGLCWGRFSVISRLFCFLKSIRLSLSNPHQVTPATGYEIEDFVVFLKLFVLPSLFRIYTVH